MRRIASVIPLVLLIGAGLIGLKSAQAESALEMASLCRPVAKSKMDADSIVWMPRTYESGMCWGAFAAIQTAFNIGDEGQLYLRVCLPENSTRLQLIRVFLRYVDEHPESEHEDFVIIGILAFREAFPCQ